MAQKSPRKRRHKPVIKKEYCRVMSVYDGDTITVERTRSSWLGLKRHEFHTRLRLAYIDTPELRYKEFGAVSAKEMLEELVEGKRVMLEYEVLPSGHPRTGDFNRILAVVHLQRLVFPNININEFLLRKGLARLYHRADDITPHHRRRFVRAEKYAKRCQIGVFIYRLPLSISLYNL